MNGLVSSTFTLEQKYDFKLDRNNDLTFIVITISTDKKTIIVIIVLAISPSPILETTNEH